MANGKFWHNGNALDFVNGTEKVILAGTVVGITNRIGIATTKMAPGEKGALAVTGVYKLPKTGTEIITQGQDVYWDGTGVTNATSNGLSEGDLVNYIMIGYAAAPATATASEICVKLKG